MRKKFSAIPNSLPVCCFGVSKAVSLNYHIFPFLRKKRVSYTYVSAVALRFGCRFFYKLAGRKELTAVGYIGLVFLDQRRGRCRDTTRCLRAGEGYGTSFCYVGVCCVCILREKFSLPSRFSSTRRRTSSLLARNDHRRRLRFVIARLALNRQTNRRQRTALFLLRFLRARVILRRRLVPPYERPVVISLYANSLLVFVRSRHSRRVVAPQRFWYRTKKEKTKVFTVNGEAFCFDDR